LQSLRRFQILRRLARCVFAWVSRKYCKHLLIFDFRLRGDHAPGAAERPRIVRPLLVCCLGRKSCSSVAVISMRLKTTPTSTRDVWDTSRNPTTSATNSGSPGRESSRTSQRAPAQERCASSPSPQNVPKMLRYFRNCPIQVPDLSFKKNDHGDALQCSVLGQFEAVGGQKKFVQLV